ncbi:hypothetical protein ElyMa_006443300 [Elysia marginata]|uniref:Secreted protein n=1 Tax=Elysia marginata TaxID=1093978 RepID=A0AAV4HY62_9GAST|nr:hypothetical protein ElyMa_006443300 [Elysia marginata]
MRLKFLLTIGIVLVVEVVVVEVIVVEVVVVVVEVVLVVEAVVIAVTAAAAFTVHYILTYNCPVIFSGKNCNLSRDQSRHHNRQNPDLSSQRHISVSLSHGNESRESRNRIIGGVGLMSIVQNTVYHLKRP